MFCFFVRSRFPVFCLWMKTVESSGQTPSRKCLEAGKHGQNPSGRPCTGGYIVFYPVEFQSIFTKGRPGLLLCASHAHLVILKINER